MYFKPDGSIEFKESTYDMSKPEGDIIISKYEYIHYIEAEYLTGNSFFIGLYHDHQPLHAATTKIILLSSSFFFLFLLLISSCIYINIRRFKNLIESQKAIIYALAALAEWRDNETGKYLERTRKYAVAIAKELRKNKKYKKIITGEYIEDLYYAAPLHDTEKVGIRDAILLKKSRLTDEEYEEMKKHTLIGKKIIQDTIEKYKLTQSFLIMSRNIIKYHHEKYNGKGYPKGLKGEAIPLEARIFAICF